MARSGQRWPDRHDLTARSSIRGGQTVGRETSMSTEPLPDRDLNQGADDGSGDMATTGVRRILLVDDEEGIRESLSTYLETNGFQVDTAADAIAARRMIGESTYDLVLTDISMPEVSGLDLLAQIKDEHPSLEVIMITGYLDISFAIQAMRRGAYDFFTKPFNYEKILLTIERVEEKRRLEDQARRYESLRQQKQFEQQAILETTLGLARAGEERDRYNIGHGKRTAEFALMIADKLGYSDERKKNLRYASLLHDVGKIGIDDQILNKPGRLDEQEFAAIKRHSEIGEYILTPISFLSDIAEVVRHHHERWDGTGYPDGIAGEAIPIDARILCIADYFDSITSARPYRRPMETEKARALIREEAGKTFDPTLADVFLEGLGAALGQA
ncbi:MAG: two-component system response regulator [Planctomycetes bacterium]|nr:two-component system response regulator [Planctomycetota bacterium]